MAEDKSENFDNISENVGATGEIPFAISPDQRKEKSVKALKEIREWYKHKGLAQKHAGLMKSDIAKLTRDDIARKEVHEGSLSAGLGTEKLLHPDFNTEKHPEINEKRSKEPAA